MQSYKKNPVPKISLGCNNGKKFLCLFLLSLSLVTTVSAQQQSITLKESKMSIVQIFKSIEQQTGFSIAYSRDKLNVFKEVQVSNKTASLNDILLESLAGTNYGYKINSKHIVIIPNVAEKKRKAELVTSKPAEPIAIRQVVEEVPITVSNSPQILQPSPIRQELSVPIDRTIPFKKQSMPAIAVKSNLLYDLTTSINLGLEFRLSSKYTLDIAASYNPWEFSQTKMMKHILVQPELRYWINEPFNRHFLGVHGTYAHYNVGGFDLGSLKNNRYQGDLYGFGFSYGYNWYLAPRWSMEATLGFGYIYLDNVNQDCATCPNGKGLESNYQHYVGPTKAGISLIYHIK